MDEDESKLNYTPDPDENLYIVSRRHIESNEVIFDRPVKVCTECGVVYIHKPHRLGQCPLLHDQRELDPDAKSSYARG